MFSSYLKHPKRNLPAFPNWWAALGPGVVWMALAQGSGELIWWPYLIAKYGLVFLSLLIPACLLQFPITLEIGRYTLLTGESIFQGFFRLNKYFGVFLWVLMTISFLWFGAFASAGGTALAELTHFPDGWTTKSQTLFWGYATIVLFVVSVFLSRHIYKFIENFMKMVALITVFGLLWACSEPQVLETLPSFVQGMMEFPTAFPAHWQAEDASKLLTAITFAGLGGFWILFYSYWLRDKGSGMAAYMPRITGIVAKHEVLATLGALPFDNAHNATLWKQWRRFLTLDISVGIIGNLLTTLMMCLLAWALLYPKGLIPQDYEIAVVQAKFF
ncbi:MAG: Nramp family divalent metal transporter, partial [Methylophilaceae bacterium]